jgi:hypothetical protein
MKGKMQTLLFFRRERIKYRRSLGTGTGMCMKHIIQVSRKWRTHYLLPDRGCLNVHEKNMEKNWGIRFLTVFLASRYPCVCLCDFV